MHPYWVTIAVLLVLLCGLPALELAAGSTTITLTQAPTTERSATDMLVAAATGTPSTITSSRAASTTSTTAPLLQATQALPPLRAYTFRDWLIVNGHQAEVMVMDARNVDAEVERFCHHLFSANPELQGADCEPLKQKYRERATAILEFLEGNSTWPGVSHERLELYIGYTKANYWAALCPDLHVGEPWDKEYFEAPLAFDDDELAAYSRFVGVEGYFKSRPHSNSTQQWNLPVPLAAMAECIEHLRRAGWPGVFAYIYDEFWMAAGRLGPIIKAMLGDDAVMLPDFWVFNVHPVTADTSGWRVHRDRIPPTFTPLGEDGSANSLNMWVPLTEATPLNGCMYILPRQYDPTPATMEAMHATQGCQNISTSALPLVRALPVLPGQYMGWDGWVMHWGSRASGHASAKPRINFAIEYQRLPSDTVEAMNAPLMPLGYNPPLDMRLQLVSKQFANYWHIREYADERVEGFAANVVAVLAASDAPRGAGLMREWFQSFA